MDRLISTRVIGQWVVYELLDPGKPGEPERVIHRDYDTQDYVNMIRAYPVYEPGQAGYLAVDKVYRAGRVPYMKILAEGLTEGAARQMCRVGLYVVGGTELVVNQ